MERTISDLSGRVEELEREAAELRRENGWLKEIVMLKSKRLAGVVPELEPSPSSGASGSGHWTSGGGGGSESSHGRRGSVTSPPPSSHDSSTDEERVRGDAKGPDTALYSDEYHNQIACAAQK